VGRIVVGPSGETVRVGTGFGGATRERTTLVALAAGAVAASEATGTGAASAGAASAGAAAAGAAAAGAAGGGVTLAVRTGASSAGAVGAAGVVAFAALVAFVAFSDSAGTSRRSPSASARRRMRSACASSIDADGLEAPIPSF
jgi:hypothetical protein